MDEIEPLTPIDSDLQDFPFMPLHVARLRDSDLAAEEDPETCWYALLLWSSSWHQLPAGSLPDNDTVLMKLVGLGRDTKTWKKHKAGALRGFIKCSDGRLYHPVVAEQVCEAWTKKLEQRWRSECARIKKHNQRHDANITAPTFEEFVASGPMSVPRDNAKPSLGTDGSCPPGNALQETETGTETGNIKEEHAAAAASGKYAFEGQVIRLTPPDLERWKQVYHAIPDLEAELTSLDAWFVGTPEKQAKWFHTAAGSLSRKHQQFLTDAKSSGQSLIDSQTDSLINHILKQGAVR